MRLMDTTPVDPALRMLADLDPQQREAVQAVRGPVCILAGAGTGKTRTITHRIGYAVGTGAVAASQLLAVTFTARAAGEMRARLRRLGVAGVQARTFHSAAMRQLRYFAPRVLGGPLPELAEHKVRLVTQAALRCRLNVDGTLRRDLASEIEWAKASLVGPEQYVPTAGKLDREPPVEPATMAAVYAAYEEVKQQAGVLDFEDLLLVTAVAIEDHRDVAEEVRARYRHFVVDEYQDVNPLQQRLLDAWLGGREDLCVVGDANQTIYSFTGASPEYLLGFGRRFPGALVVKLERDYRSTPQVVALANRLIAGARGTARGARLRLVGQRPGGPEPTFAEYDDEPAEAAAVAAGCVRLIAGGTPPAEIAVLFRVNAQSESYEAALAAAGVPYVLRGGERFFERTEIREATVLLRAAARSADPEAPLVQAVTDVLSATGWSPEARPAGGAGRERWESLAALVQLAEDLAAARSGDGAAGLAELVAELEQRAAAQHAPTVQGVTLASLHAAKGLEWDAVFLVGLADGTLPIQHASTEEQVEEERRLLYVGITRAREHLALSWALARSPGARRGRRASRFLLPLLPEPAGRPARPEPGARGGKPAAVCVECGGPLRKGAERALGRCADCPGEVDVDLFERLRAWRSGRASAASVPAYVVFTDATLAAIAQTRPADAADLVRLPGIGPHKLDQYGADVLAIVAGKLPEGA
jgi:DNA helicase-2/ATP-dependent DNA helicase PcrA